MRDTSKMSVNRETHGSAETQQHPQDGAAAGVSFPPPPPSEPVPPPPSAPAEFLSSQWLELAPVARAPGKAGAPLAAPPPTAPGEFLSAQWRDGVMPEFAPDEAVLAAFRDAAPDYIRNNSQLRSLAVESEPLQEADTEGHLASDEESTPVRLREVSLTPGEEVSLVFLPGEGVVDAVPRSGQALILTSSRLIAFRGVEGFRDTHIALASEISQCSVRTGQRNWGAILQGLMIMVGGAFLYLIVGYWLAGQVSGPNVPVLNIDVAPLIALLIVLAGAFVLASNYFMRPAGALIFHGQGVEIAFPFRSSLEMSQVYDFVDRAHSARRRKHANDPHGDS